MTNHSKNNSSQSQPSSSSQSLTPSTSSQSERASINQRRRFTILFKLRAVKLFERFGSKRAVARDLRINRKTLRVWVQQKVNFYLFSTLFCVVLYFIINKQIETFTKH